MAFTLPPLPWAKEALEPHISRETIEFHYGKHHQGYVTKLNGLAKGTSLEKRSLEELIMTEKGKIFNLAAQIWNHTFYWNGMKPATNQTPVPGPKLGALIDKEFGSFEKFRQQFTDAAANHFGSGWAWLALDKSGKLVILTTSDAANPMTQGLTPLLTCDVWEHAYYIDKRHDRLAYINAWWNVVNWDTPETLFKPFAKL